MRELVTELHAWLAWAQDTGLQNLAQPARPAPSNEPPEPQTVSPTKLPLLESVRAELGECTRCKLHRTRTNIGFGVGNPEARLMLAPGHWSPGNGVSHGNQPRKGGRGV